MSPVICPNCKKVVPAEEIEAGWCENCGKKLPSLVLSGTSATTQRVGGGSSAGPNPWTPGQMVGASFVFGVLSAGILSGLNCSRMGKRSYLVPCVIAGFLLYGVMAVLVFVLLRADSPEITFKVGGIVLRLAVGFGFMLVQQPIFEEWKAAHGDGGADKKSRYKPGGMGKFFLVGLGCAAVEVSVILLIFSMS